MGTAAAVAPDATDVCSFGHQLVAGSDEITIKEYDEDGRKTSEQTLLLRRHAGMGPKGLYGGGERKTELDSRGQIVREWVEGADPQDHGITPTKVTKLVAYPCAHGLPESDVDPEDLPYFTFRGPSYGRAHWLTYSFKILSKMTIPVAHCPVCRGEPAPDWRA